MTVTPTQLTISAPGNTATLSVSETNYSGTWTGSSNNPTIATIVQSSPGVFTVTGVSVGRCHVTIADTAGNSVNVKVTVQ